MTWTCICGTTYTADVEVCETDGLPRPLPAMEAREPSMPSPVVPPATPAGPAAPVGGGSEVECPGCGRTSTPGSAHWSSCNGARQRSAPTVHLILPGNVVVPLDPGQPIVLGREADDPAIAAAFAAHDQVSRRHAVVVVNGGVLQVTDTDSTNGTFVDDLQVVRQTTVPLGAGVRLRFGRELELDVTPGGGS